VGGTNGRKKKMVAKGINFDNLMANRVMNSHAVIGMFFATCHKDLLLALSSFRYN